MEKFWKFPGKFPTLVLHWHSWCSVFSIHLQGVLRGSYGSLTSLGSSGFSLESTWPLTSDPNNVLLHVWEETHRKDDLLKAAGGVAVQSPLTRTSAIIFLIYPRLCWIDSQQVFAYTPRPLSLFLTVHRSGCCEMTMVQISANNSFSLYSPLHCKIYSSIWQMAAYLYWLLYRHWTLQFNHREVE